MSILMFINLKGGVAKTTNAVAIAEFLAEAGNKVLVIDADHQCAAGELLLGENCFLRCEGQSKTLHDLLSAIVKDDYLVESFDQYIVPIPGAADGSWRSRLSVVPGSIRIDDFQQNYNGSRMLFSKNRDFLSTVNGRLLRFRNWLNKNYDYVIIDCPPSLPLQVQMLVKVADAYIVPSVPDKLSVRGVGYLLERLKRKHFTLPGLGMIWTLYREQNPLHGQMKHLVKSRKDIFKGFPDCFETVVPNSTAIVRAISLNCDSLIEKYTYPFASMYRALVGEIVDRCKKLDKAKRRQARRKLAGV